MTEIEHMPNNEQEEQANARARWDNLGHIINFVAIIIAAVLFIQELKTQTTIITERLSNHLSQPAHPEMLEQSQAMAIQLTSLATVVLELQSDVQELERRQYEGRERRDG